MKNYAFFFWSAEDWKVPVDSLVQQSHLKIRKPGVEEVEGLICWLCVPVPNRWSG